MIRIIDERCKSCDLCITYCPKNVLKYSEDKTVWGRIPYPAREENCTGCRMCEMVCPDFAILYQEE